MPDPSRDRRQDLEDWLDTLDYANKVAYSTNVHRLIINYICSDILTTGELSQELVAALLVIPAQVVGKLRLIKPAAMEAWLRQAF